MILTVAALAALVIVQAAIVAAFLTARDRADQRASEERESDRKERQILLNRIQAPETAVAQTLEPSPPVQSLDPTSDEDYWQFVTEQRVA